MKDYTILEAAAVCGVSKNTIKYRMKKIPGDLCRQGAKGVWYISEAGLQMLKTEEPPSTTFNHAKTTEEPPSTTQEPVTTTQKPLEEPPSTTKEPPSDERKTTEKTTQKTADPELVSMLQDTIKMLQAQLDVKDRQISDLTAALLTAQNTAAAAQALHAGTLKQLEGSKAADPEPQQTAPTITVNPEPQQVTPEEGKKEKQSFWKRLFG